MDDLLNAIKDVLRDEKPEQVLPKLGEKYLPIPYSLENYHEIPQNAQDMTVTFIDGGNAEILTSSHFSLSFIRVVAITFTETRKKHTEKTEFYLLTTSKNQEEIKYTSRIFPVTGTIFPQESELSLSSVDETLRHGTRRATPSSLAGVARRFSELLLAQHLLEHKKNDVVVLDGNLQATYTNESAYLQQIEQLAKQKKKKVISIGKTTTLFANTGNTFASLLYNNKKGAWYYYPVGKTEKGPEIYFAKLHPLSKHVFMLESFDQITDEIMSSLKLHASDPVFLGYPYGLVEADRAARVSNQEATYLKTKIISLLGNPQQLEHLLSTQNAHSILDSLSFNPKSL